MPYLVYLCVDFALASFIFDDRFEGCNCKYYIYMFSEEGYGGVGGERNKNKASFCSKW